MLPGALFFAWSSATWGGGVAFYDPSGTWRVLARAWLVTREQLADIAAQEMGRDPGGELDLATVLADRVHRLGPGRYETLHLVAELEGRPVLTVTAPQGHGLAPNPPSEAYRATITRGLAESHGLTPEQSRVYLDGWLGPRAGGDG